MYHMDWKWMEVSKSFSATCSIKNRRRKIVPGRWTKRSFTCQISFLKNNFNINILNIKYHRKSRYGTVKKTFYYCKPQNINYHFTCFCVVSGVNILFDLYYKLGQCSGHYLQVSVRLIPVVICIGRRPLVCLGLRGWRGNCVGAWFVIVVIIIRKWHHWRTKYARCKGWRDYNEKDI